VLLLSARRPSLAVAAAAIPHLLYPQGLRGAIANHSAESLLDAYIQLAEETCGNIGFVEGLWLFRDLVPEAVKEAEHREGMGLVP
jgi:hypothetical protein